MKMKSRLTVRLPTRRECLSQSIEIGLDEQWKRKRKDFPDAAKKKGVYVLYSEKPRDILYVGKT
ncbi:MAG: hypothetical protein WBC98_08095, partial [Candidatus Zixiibacteriota bacterium]